MIAKENNENYSMENIFGSKGRLKVLMVLALNSEMSITQIIKNTKLNHTNVKKHLHYLESLNLIQEKKFGRIKIYRYKIENLKAISLKRFIQIWENTANNND